jgi:Leucine-rich repeat (LRR) protein
MWFDCLQSLKSFGNCFYKNVNYKEQIPHIKVIYEEEVEDLQMIEDFIFMKRNIIVEREEVFITVEDLLKFDKKDLVTKISLRNMALSDISFITQFQNVLSLDISFNNLRDLTVLGELKKLKKLNLSYNTFSTLKGLENCTDLEELYMIFNNIDKIDELKFLTNLKFLDIEDTKVDSIEILDELKHLEYVYTPFICSTGNIKRKLKSEFTFSQLSGKGNMNATLYLNKFYLLSDGINIGRKKFIL